VNSSDEEEKSGIDPADAIPLAKFVAEKCPFLHLTGFMTIGSVEESEKSDDNNDFRRLQEIRRCWVQKSGTPFDQVFLSMGMSSDFELAVKMGSTHVRVGSLIFGDRQRKT